MWEPLIIRLILFIHDNVIDVIFFMPVTSSSSSDAQNQICDLIEEVAD